MSKILEPKIVLMQYGTRIPTKANPFAACFDIYSAADVLLKAGKTTKIPTNIKIESPETHHIQLYSRSSMAKRNIIVVGGVIDTDYRGEIFVMLHNSSDSDYQIVESDRIAQFKFVENIDAKFKVVDELSCTERADGSFGSSGR